MCDMKIMTRANFFLFKKKRNVFYLGKEKNNSRLITVHYYIENVFWSYYILLPLLFNLLNYNFFDLFFINQFNTNDWKNTNYTTVTHDFGLLLLYVYQNNKKCICESRFFLELKYKLVPL